MHTKFYSDLKWTHHKGKLGMNLSNLLIIGLNTEFTIYFFTKHALQSFFMAKLVLQKNTHKHVNSSFPILESNLRISKTNTKYTQNILGRWENYVVKKVAFALIYI